MLQYGWETLDVEFVFPTLCFTDPESTMASPNCLMNGQWIQWPIPIVWVAYTSLIRGLAVLEKSKVILVYLWQVAIL